ncbi:hypothetical protein ACFU9X_45500 [Streptomyces atratus]|uniref:hypothetical protein n=1 Tax=Streptomyces atratus TaxID=1893 RepID=UPI0036CC2332
MQPCRPDRLFPPQPWPPGFGFQRERGTGATCCPVALQRILLGDANQCIYAGFKHIDADARIGHSDAAAWRRQDPFATAQLPRPERNAAGRRRSRPATRLLPPRHPHGRRRGSHLGHRADGHGHAEVIGLARRARKAGHTVSIFTHTNLATFSLSDAFLADGLVHEQVGLAEACGEALAAQIALVKHAANVPKPGVLSGRLMLVRAERFDTLCRIYR